MPNTRSDHDRAKTARQVKRSTVDDLNLTMAKVS
jgi:hypothetical protein